jgi:hypothetical protein
LEPRIVRKDLASTGLKHIKSHRTLQRGQPTALHLAPSNLTATPNFLAVRQLLPYSALTPFPSAIVDNE